jgi:UDP-glucose 4-epimerase
MPCSPAEAVVQHAAPRAVFRYTGGSRGWVGDVPKFRHCTDKLKALDWSPKLGSDAAVERAVREVLAEAGG